MRQRLPSSLSVRIKQHVYFALRSQDVSGEAMAQGIGLAADRAMVRGSKIAGPRPKPIVHSWEIVCETAGMTVDEQIERVLDRMERRSCS
jgi:hypothetical protein